jgi:hypothetical protein
MTSEQTRFRNCVDHNNRGTLMYPANEAKLQSLKNEEDTFTLSESLEKWPRSANIASAPKNCSFRNARV